MKKYLLITLSLFLLACSDDKKQQEGGGMPPATVRLAQAEPGTMAEILTIAGSLEARRSALISAEIAGTVEAVHVNDGQSVEKGDLLFAIDSASLEAELKRAEANVELRVQEKKRAQSLFDRKAASEYDVDKATALLATALAERDYARAQLAKAGIRAPFAGKVGIRRVNEGAYVQPATALIPLTQTNPLLLDFSAPETVLAVIDVGTKLDVMIPALSLGISATISAIEPMVSQSTRSVRVRADVANDRGLLRPGMFARVSLPVSVAGDILWLPETALFYQADRQMLMINDDGKGKRIEVQVAGFKEGRVAIKSGLDPQAEVVIGGHHKVAFDGMPIMPVGDDADSDDSVEPEGGDKTPAQQQQAE